MGSLWIIDIHWWLLWGAATRERNCLGTADRGPCDIGDNGCWRWHCFLPLSALIYIVSRCFKFPFHISPNETVQWIQRIERGRFVGSCSGVCTFWILLTFLTRWLVAYALATPGVSWAMGATAECFRLSSGRSGTWPASNASNVFYIVLLFLVISRYFLFILTYFDLLILLGYYGILKSELKLEGVSNRFGIPPSGFQIQEE